MFERFTEKAIKVIMLAQEEARRLGHNFVGTEQILLGLVGEGTGIAAKTLKQMGINLKDARVEVEKIIGRGSGFVAVEIPFTPRAKRVLELAWDEARQLGHNYIGTEHLLLGLIREGEGVAAKVLEGLNVDISRVRSNILKMLNESGTVASGVGGGTSSSGASGGTGRSKTPTLDEFGTNLSQAALDGKLDPVVGRENEIERTIQILGRRTKNNPVLIGEPGVGKTAIAEGLAQRIMLGDVPEFLLDKKIVQLDIGLLVAGTKYRGEFEERLKKIMDEIKTSTNIVLVIDELHTLVGAGAAEGAIDAANILKPVLARGELRCIGATTLEEYRKHIEKDAALERRFQPVNVGEPSVDETVEILRGLRDKYEEHHGLTITDEALVAAANLSERYIADRFLPDKAIDLIDEASSFVRLKITTLPPEGKELEKKLTEVRREKEQAVRDQSFESAASLRDDESDLMSKLDEMRKELREKASQEGAALVVTDSDIASVVSRWTGIPVGDLTEQESDKLQHMEETLHNRVIGQDQAIRSVSLAIRRARVGLKNPNRPIGNFIFAGPTGVGKTELAKALASFFFGSEEAIIRVDMSEFMERHTTSRLVGSPPGYVGFGEGGELTERVRRRPYSVVLFDEIEKAHPDVFNIMLQVLDDGRLTDSKGRVVSFKNTIIIMTSNVGARSIENDKQMGFNSPDSEGDQQLTYKRMQGKLMEDMKRTFRPEFLNRVDEIIIFHRLNGEHLSKILDLMMKNLLLRLKDRNISMEISQPAKDFLCLESQRSDRPGMGIRTEGNDMISRDGARPLLRVIQRELENVLAEKLLSKDIQPGDIVKVDYDEENKKLIIDKTSSPTKKSEKAKKDKPSSEPELSTSSSQ